jgi:hypothetical protein
VMDRSPTLRSFYERNKDWYDLIDDVEHPPTPARARIGVPRHKRRESNVLRSAHNRHTL